jgi:hypothetical protein
MNPQREQEYRKELAKLAANSGLGVELEVNTLHVKMDFARGGAIAFGIAIVGCLIGFVTLSAWGLFVMAVWSCLMLASLIRTTVDLRQRLRLAYSYITRNPRVLRNPQKKELAMNKKEAAYRNSLRYYRQPELQRLIGRLQLRENVGIICTVVSGCFTLLLTVVYAVSKQDWCLVGAASFSVAVLLLIIWTLGVHDRRKIAEAALWSLRSRS